ncbi:MAG: type II secretion system major pseudopilin GspG [Nitrospiraceae bacterium]|nr:type II secretion system major pseudopilin GspG [Nitrospiraceae bacterium]
MENRVEKKRVTNDEGFTLIELLVVMVILGLLAALVGPRLFGNVDKANVSATKTQVEMLGSALDAFRLDVGRYPSTAEGLNALITNPGIDGWNGPYLKKNVVPNDAWKKPFQYQSPGSHGEYDLFSYGADGTPGGDGFNKDIDSWQ